MITQDDLSFLNMTLYYLFLTNPNDGTLNKENVNTNIQRCHSNLTKKYLINIHVWFHRILATTAFNTVGKSVVMNQSTVPDDPVTIVSVSCQWQHTVTVRLEILLKPRTPIQRLRVKNENPSLCKRIQTTNMTLIAWIKLNGKNLWQQIFKTPSSKEQIFVKYRDNHQPRLN